MDLAGNVAVFKSLTKRHDSDALSTQILNHHCFIMSAFKYDDYYKIIIEYSRFELI